MRRDKGLLPIIEAWLEGKEVEVQSGGKWTPLPFQPGFNARPDRYRIKPEPETFFHIFRRNGYQVTGVPIKDEALAIKTCVDNDRNNPEYAPYYLKKFVQDLDYKRPA